MDIRNEKISAVYKTHRRKMLGVCMKYTKNRDDAEDFLHDGILKAMEKYEMLDNEKNPVPYIMRIVINNMLDKFRVSKRMTMVGEEHLYDNDIVDDSTVDYGDTECLQNICVSTVNTDLDSISERDSQIFKMHVMDGYKHNEIADMLNINYNTVRCTYVRVRNRLNDSITKKMKQVI